jgi:hypothetical protein
MLHLYAALAEKQRRLIADRTRQALAAARATEQGSAIGEIAPQAAACIRGMVSIAEALNSRGVFRRSSRLL